MKKTVIIGPFSVRAHYETHAHKNDDEKRLSYPMRVQITLSEVGDLNYSLVDFRMSRAMKFSYRETATLSFTVHVAGESTTEDVCVHCEVNPRVKGS